MAGIAKQARDLHWRAVADSRTAAATAGLAAASSDAAQQAQQMAGELLRQQLQLLTVDSQDAESPLLTKLLRACIVTSGLMTAFTAAPVGTATMWRPHGIVAGDQHKRNSSSLTHT